MQADMVLEELKVSPTSCRQQEVNYLTGHGLSIYEPSKPASTVTHFLQDHTYSDKATPPNGATLWGPFSFKPSHLGSFSWQSRVSCGLCRPGSHNEVMLAW